jgi:hypothetical protein
MAQHTQDNAQTALEDQLRECFGRVVYSHKAHEKTADIYLVRLSRIKLAQIVLSALTTGGLGTSLLGPADRSQHIAVVSTLLSAALLALNAYAKDLDLGQMAERHKETAARLWAVRESYLSLLTDLKDWSIEIVGLRASRDELHTELAEIYKAAPRTLDKAYERAGIALKDREELTFSEAEIDRFLPNALRRHAEVLASREQKAGEQ